jgi:hypothetical protein
MTDEHGDETRETQRLCTDMPHCEHTKHFDVVRRRLQKAHFSDNKDVFDTKECLRSLELAAEPSSGRASSVQPSEGL